MQTTAIHDYLHELGRQVNGHLRTDEISLTLYSTDASIYQVKPYGVLIPTTLEDVHAAVQLAAKYRVPVLPRAAGSSLAGQAVNEALVIDFTRHLNHILEVNQAEQWVRVQPGLVLDELNLHLKPLGLQFGPDPASSNRAAIGGIVSNNSTGAHSILYGMTVDHVLETNVILSDGSRANFGPVSAEETARRSQWNGLEGQLYRRVGHIAQTHADTIRTGTPHHWRRCGGYNLDRFVSGPLYKYPHDNRFNLANLMCGAEGTLAVLTDIKLNLTPLPTKTALAIVHFDSLAAALSAVPAMLQVEPSAIELLDNLGLTLCREVPAYARLLAHFVEGRPNCVLITEFYGESEAELAAKIDRLKSRLKQQQVATGPIVPALTPEAQNRVWTVRKVGLGLLMSIKGDYKPIPFIEDAAVPVEHLAEYVTRIEEFCNDLGTKVAYYAHASAGCIHIRPLINAKLAAEVDKLPVIAAFSAELVGQYNGAFSSEHGDGRSRSWLNEQFFGPALYGLFKEVKQTFDPHNLLNPGNIVNAGPMTNNLRYGPAYQVMPLTEHLDFSQDQGFHRAVEMCNGAGICRKRTTGTMCPSFMVTRDETHSTRGRANALRAALSGLLPAAALTGPQMYNIMDLCVECKACKAECPSSVDMAKIKFEFLAHYYKHNPVPLRVKLFADIAFWSHLGSGMLAPLSNFMLKNRAVRWAIDKWLGISRQRPLPEMAAMPFTLWFKHRQKQRANGQITKGKSQRANHKGQIDRQGAPDLQSPVSNPQKKVVLFNDTFNTYNYPHVAIAATEVLEAAGFEVILPGHKCCGRPMISKGLVEQARRAAADTVVRLLPLAQQGLPIVGLEPGCLLSIRDEYFDLLPGDPRVKTVADQCYTFEEFIANLAQAGEFDLPLNGSARPVLLHGHCHQKSLVGTEPAFQTLNLPGHTVTEVDSGCCGMAGSFGYEAEHYDISMAMAERRLLPAVRQQSDDTLIAAAGVSCRQQILHGTGRQALHPAEILRAALQE